MGNKLGTSWASSWGSGAAPPVTGVCGNWENITTIWDSIADKWETIGVCPVPTLTGGHFIPEKHGHHKRTLSNILTIYNKAKELPRQETKELRDAISEFVEPAIARQASLPEIIKVDYEALRINEEAYEKFARAMEI